MAVERRQGREPFSDKARQAAMLLVFACAIFIVYGSLYPFNFQATAAPVTADTFDWHAWRNRSDAVDNVLLFMPLGAAIFYALRTAAGRMVATAACWAVLGVGMQVLQLYLPGRVGSVADAMNNALGLLIGLLMAKKIAPWLRGTQLRGRFGDPMAMFLVVAWYMYESFPFLPTLDVGLLAAHIKAVLASTGFEWLRLLRHALAAALGTLALLAVQPLRSRRAGLAIAAFVLLASEVLVPYGDLRLEALLGIVLGMALGERLDHHLPARRNRAVLALALVAFVTSVVTDFRGSPEMARFTWTPFSHLLWQGTTIGIPTSAFEALAIGSLMWGATGWARAEARPWQWPAVVIALVILLEGLRIHLRTGPADSSTLVIAVLLAPFAAMTYRRERSRPRSDPNHALPTELRERDMTGPGAPIPARNAVASPLRSASRRLGWWPAALALVALTIGLLLLLEAPSLPYNVTKLLGGRNILHLGLFAGVLLWIGAGPWWVSRLASGRLLATLRLPALLLLAAWASLLVLWLAVPSESLDKVTGSLDLYRRVTTENYWGPAWSHRMADLSSTTVSALERVIRYTALYGLLLVPMTMAAVCLDRQWPLHLALPALAVLAPCWWLAKRVVVEGAITDNLIELIAADGVPWLAALALVFSLHVAWAALRRPSSARGGLVFGALTIAALPIGWWLLKQGLEQVILKYGTVWSAQQFLLGQSRTASLSDGQLFLRWCALYLSLLTIGVLGMTLARREWSRRRSEPLPAERGRGLSHAT